MEGKRSKSRLESRTRGRPARGSLNNDFCSDDTEYVDIGALAAASRAAAIEEFPIHWPWIGLAELRGYVELMQEPETRMWLPAGPYFLDASTIQQGWILRMAQVAGQRDHLYPENLREYCQCALDYSPRELRRREALVVALGCLWRRDAPEGAKLGYANSRPFGVASIAAGEEVQSRGSQPWTVRKVFTAEGNAVMYQLKKRAAIELLVKAKESGGEPQMGPSL